MKEKYGPILFIHFFIFYFLIYFYIWAREPREILFGQFKWCAVVYVWAAKQMKNLFAMILWIFLLFAVYVRLRQKASSPKANGIVLEPNKSHAPYSHSMAHILMGNILCLRVHVLFILERTYMRALVLLCSSSILLRYAFMCVLCDVTHLNENKLRAFE